MSLFNEMLIDHLPRLMAYAMTLTRNRTEADELLQQTSLRAIKSQEQFAPGTNFGGWIFTILRHEFYDMCRRTTRTRRKTENIDDVPSYVMARPGNQEECLLVKEVMRAIGTIDDKQAEILMLICVQGMGYEEAAAVVGCSMGTLKSRLWRGRKRVQELLGAA